MEASTVAMAALGIRMGPPKFLATWSPAADAAGQGLDRHPVRVAALLPDGTYGMVQFNPVPPHGDPDGSTPAERGAIKFLGVFISYGGVGNEGEDIAVGLTKVPGGRWHETYRTIFPFIRAFGMSTRTLQPSLRQLSVLVRSVLMGKAGYVLRAARPSSAVYDKLRGMITACATHTLGLGHVSTAPTRTTALVCNFRTTSLSLFIENCRRQREPTQKA